MKIIYVDIDNTICKTEGCDYKNASPITDRINKINSLYDKGCEIVYWTARGTVTGENHLILSNDQLIKWGCKFHKLKTGKPHYDLFIDDKNINSEKFFNI